MNGQKDPVKAARRPNTTSRKPSPAPGRRQAHKQARAAGRHNSYHRTLSSYRSQPLGETAAPGAAGCCREDNGGHPPWARVQLRVSLWPAGLD